MGGWWGGGLSCLSVCVGRVSEDEASLGCEGEGGGVKLSPPDRLFREEGGAIGERAGLFPRPGL